MTGISTEGRNLSHRHAIGNEAKRNEESIPRQFELHPCKKRYLHECLWEQWKNNRLGGTSPKKWWKRRKIQKYIHYQRKQISACHIGTGSMGCLKNKRMLFQRKVSSAGITKIKQKSDCSHSKKNACGYAAIIATARKLWNMLYKKEAYKPYDTAKIESQIRDKQIKKINKLLHVFDIKMSEINFALCWLCEI